MFLSTGFALKSYLLQAGLTPMIVAQGVVIPQKGLVSFSASQFLMALFAGVVMAFTFQLLLTNFSVASGISSLGNDSDDASSESLGGTIRKIETKVGWWVLVTATIALFCASFLAVKLSLINSGFLGAIIGVVIWSTYFLVLVWMGSSALGSVTGALVSTATSGVQGLMGTATAAISANAAKAQMVSTVEDITAAVRRELTSGLDPNSIRNALQSSLASLPLPKLDLQEVRNQFARLLSDANLQSLGDSDVLKNINRQTFVDLLSSRTDFSKEDINRIADQLEDAWKEVVNRQNPTDRVIDFLWSATSRELNSEHLGERLQELVTVGGNGSKSNDANGGGGIQPLIQYGLSAAVPAVLNRVDFSNVDVDKVTSVLPKLKEKVQDLDIDKITSQLKHLGDQTREQIAKQLPASSDNTIKTDVENYIRNSFPWHFNRITIKDEFKDIIYDPNADPSTVKRQLEELNAEYFNNLLTQRDDINEARVKEIVEQLESVRLEVLETVQQSATRKQFQDFRTRIEEYLRSTPKEELNLESIEREFARLLEDPEAGVEDLSDRFGELNRDVFVQLLQQRGDFNEEEANNIIGQLELSRDHILNRARELQEQAKAKADELRQRVEDYLRNTGKEELNPEGIKRDFRVLLEDPQAGISLLRTRLSQFDRDTLAKLLSQRQDLDEEQVNQILDQLEAVRDNILQAPQKVADKAKEQYEQTTRTIAEYLRNTNLEELNPEGIQQDLTKLLQNPQEGINALRDRLSQIDRETLVKLLAQRGDLSEEQANRIIDAVQEAISRIVQAPGRLATRATQKVLDFEANLEDYLRHTRKEELNPEGIKRDLRLLLSSPRTGVASLGERFSKFDRSTLVALLSEREDISEEEANRIVDQIESVGNSIIEQSRQVQQRVQSVIDQIFDSIRNYLNSLNRPELNYESLQQDFAKLFDDPQAGFEALRDRLSQFDRDTLVAIVSSRQDISEEQANKIINQIEAARDSVINRSQYIQQETQKRLTAIRDQAKKQAEETKKVVARAAWWVFNIAWVSLAASAIAGALGASSGVMP